MSEEQVHKFVTNRPGISVSAGVQTQIDPFSWSVKFVTNFPAGVFEAGLECRTLNSYRSAISAFHNNGDSIATGRHP